MSKTMRAFYSDPVIKFQIMAGLAAHRAADEIVQGVYWENGKGCAVGCTLEAIRQMKGYEDIDHWSHEVAENETGIPQVLWYLDDCIFEELPNAAAKDWPEQFIDAIRPGADLSMIWPRFALWLLVEELPQSTGFQASLTEVEALYREWCESGKNPDPERWGEVEDKSRDDALTIYANYLFCQASYAYSFAEVSASNATSYVADACKVAVETLFGDDVDAARAAYAARHVAVGRQAAKLLELLRDA